MDNTGYGVPVDNVYSASNCSDFHFEIGAMLCTKRLLRLSFLRESSSRGLEIHLLPSYRPTHAPETYVIVRARYHVHRWQLDVAGAHAVVDEEDRVGVSIAAEVCERRRPSRPHSPRKRGSGRGPKQPADVSDPS